MRRRQSLQRRTLTDVIMRRRLLSTTTKRRDGTPRAYLPKIFPATFERSEEDSDAFGGEENLEALRSLDTARDGGVIERQLGHACEQAIGAGRRCRHGYAQAVLYAPIYAVGGEGGRLRAEHATCWLTCPRLVERVDALEQRENGIHDMAARVDAEVSGEMRRGLLKAHADAARVRNYLIGDDVARRIRSAAAAAASNADADEDAKKVDFIVNHTGLIGVSMRGLEETKTWKQIKCLHAQMADALVRGRKNNPIGARVLDDLEASGFDTTGDDECRRRCEV